MARILLDGLERLYSKYIQVFVFQQHLKIDLDEFSIRLFQLVLPIMNALPLESVARY